MANAVTVQTLVDGPRNVILKVEGVLDTSNASAVELIDPATLSAIDLHGQLPTKLRIDKIVYDVSSPLNAVLLWDATTDVEIIKLSGYGEFDASKFGGLVNNAGSGITGKILLTTTGYASGTVRLSLLLECVKQ